MASWKDMKVMTTNMMTTDYSHYSNFQLHSIQAPRMDNTGTLKQLSLEHKEHRKLGIHINPYMDKRYNKQTFKEIADEYIKGYQIKSGTNIIESPSKSIHDDLERTVMEYDIEPLHDFYKDYQKQDYIFGIDLADKGVEDKTYIRNIVLDKNKNMIEVNIETFGLDQRDIEPFTVYAPSLTNDGSPNANEMLWPDRFMQWPDPHPNFKDKSPEGVKWLLQKNLSVMIKTRAEPIYNAPANERTAIDTLREMITELDFRKYVKHGFILVQANNGYIYQIFRNKAHTKVWHKGQLIKEVCVRLKSNTKVPPTDNVIAFKVMVETDPAAFEELGNVYKMADAA